MRDSDYVSNDVDTAAYLARENDPAWDEQPDLDDAGAGMAVMPRDKRGRLIFATTATPERLAA